MDESNEWIRERAGAYRRQAARLQGRSRKEHRNLQETGQLPCVTDIPALTSETFPIHTLPKKKKKAPAVHQRASENVN